MPRRSSPSTGAQPGVVKRALSERVAREARSRELRSARLREERREPRAFCAASDRGVLSFGDFSLDKQRKVTRPRCGNRILAFHIIAAGDTIKKAAFRRLFKLNSPCFPPNLPPQWRSADLLLQLQQSLFACQACSKGEIALEFTVSRFSLALRSRPPNDGASGREGAAL